MNVLAMIKLMRPHQYIKNIFIFVPLFFALKITDTLLLLDALTAFIAFSVSASAIYILNDYRDIEDDQKHPSKKNRPLASGAVGQTQAMFLMAALFLVGFTVMAMLSWQATAILGLYIGLNIAYSFHLKHVAILDVTIIALGFVLRLFIGAVATGIPLSTWIVIMTFLLALFMALAKRRDDVLIYLETGKKMRKVIDGYNLQFLDAAMTIMASVVIVAYTMYTTSIEVVERIQSEYLYLTSLFVILGVLRYLQLSFVFKNSSSPTRLVLNDLFLQCTLLGWVLSFAWILY